MTFVVELAYRQDALEGPAERAQRRAYWDARPRAGVLVGGGPWRDGSGELLLCEAEDRDALVRMVHGDPGVRARRATVTVREWTPVLGRSLPRPPAAPARPSGRVPAGGLTAHELRIADMVVEGLTNRDIAAVLSVSRRAVELHITQVYLKLSIRRRAQLAAALRHVRSAV
jgi:DNA-binding CsgD family transcriptional regulator